MADPDHERRFGRLFPLYHGRRRRVSAGIPELTALHEEGYLPATIALAQAYYDDGVNQDRPRAAELWREAADRGSVSAKGMLGNIHQLGHGVDKNDAEAARWYREAAERGSGAAAHNLANMYHDGRGVPVDPIQEWIMCMIALDQTEPPPPWRLGFERRVAEIEATSEPEAIEAARGRLDEMREGYLPWEERDSHRLWKRLFEEHGDA